MNAKIEPKFVVKQRKAKKMPHNVPAPAPVFEVVLDTAVVEAMKQNGTLTRAFHWERFTESVAYAVAAAIAEIKHAAQQVMLVFARPAKTEVGMPAPLGGSKSRPSGHLGDALEFLLDAVHKHVHFHHQVTVVLA